MAETREQLQARLAALRKLMPERKCQAVTLPDLPCERPAPGFYRTICTHEHIRDHYLCPAHASSTDGFCYRCYYEPSAPHKCYLWHVPLVMGTDGWQPDDGQSRA